jgi:hypothetical protein
MVGTRVGNTEHARRACLHSDPAWVASRVEFTNSQTPVHLTARQPVFLECHFMSCPSVRVRLVFAGRLFQKGDVMAFGAIHRRARGAGAISAIGGFAVGVLLVVLLVFAFCLQ